MDAQLAGVRRWTIFFIVGLVLSGATALPIPTQLELAVRVLGEDLSAGGMIPDHMAAWWLYQFGMIVCAAVPVWAFVLGPIRGIPLWWRFIDASFGVIGFVPMWLCDRRIRAITLRH